jgi:hypothetical protein
MKIDCVEFDHFDPRGCFDRCTNLLDLHPFPKLIEMEILKGALACEAHNKFNQRHYFDGIIPPPSLESLTVICPIVVIFGWLDMLVKRKTGMPKLSEITLLCRLDYGVGLKEFGCDVVTCISEGLNDLGVVVRVIEEKLGAFAAQVRKEGSVWEADWVEGRRVVRWGGELRRLNLMLCWFDGSCIVDRSRKGTRRFLGWYECRITRTGRYPAKLKANLPLVKEVSSEY